MPRRTSSILLLLCLALVPAGCDDDTTLVTEIGTTRLFPTFPGLTWQRLKDDGRPIAVAQWTFTAARFRQEGLDLDMLAGENCLATQSVESRATFSRDRCQQGLVVDARLGSVEAYLDIEFSVQVRRAVPEPIQDGGTAADYDGDGYLNEVDTCPLLSNPRQSIFKCGFIASNGSFQSDNDGDGVGDTSDNCLWIPNPPDSGLPQEDTSGAYWDAFDPDRPGVGLRDGIGDACDEQVADVMVGGETVIRMSLGPADYVQPLNRTTYLVVDIGDWDARSCNWDAGICAIPPEAIRFCIADDLNLASLGCS